MLCGTPQTAIPAGIRHRRARFADTFFGFRFLAGADATVPDFLV